MVQFVTCDNTTRCHNFIHLALFYKKIFTFAFSRVIVAPINPINRIIFFIGQA